MQSVELTNEAVEFLRAIFDAFDGDGVCQFLFSDIFSDDFIMMQVTNSNLPNSSYNWAILFVPSGWDVATS